MNGFRSWLGAAGLPALVNCGLGGLAQSPAVLVLITPVRSCLMWLETKEWLAGHMFVCGTWHMFVPAGHMFVCGTRGRGCRCWPVTREQDER